MSEALATVLTLAARRGYGVEFYYEPGATQATLCLTCPIAVAFDQLNVLSHLREVLLRYPLLQLQKIQRDNLGDQWLVEFRIDL